MQGHSAIFQRTTAFRVTTLSRSRYSLSLMATSPRPAALSASTLSRCAAVLRRIIGVPDYEAYLTHMTTHQPDAIPLTPSEFSLARMNERYKQPGSRCC